MILWDKEEVEGRAADAVKAVAGGVVKAADPAAWADQNPLALAENASAPIADIKLITKLGSRVMI